MSTAKRGTPSGTERAAAEAEGADAFNSGLSQLDNPWITSIVFNPFVSPGACIEPINVERILFNRNLAECWRRGFSHAEDSDLKRATEQAHPFEDNDPDGGH